MIYSIIQQNIREAKIPPNHALPKATPTIVVSGIHLSLDMILTIEKKTYYWTQMMSVPRGVDSFS